MVKWKGQWAVFMSLRVSMCVCLCVRLCVSLCVCARGCEVVWMDAWSQPGWLGALLYSLHRFPWLVDSALLVTRARCLFVRQTTGEAAQC